MTCSLVLDPNTFVVLEADAGMSQLLGVPASKLVGRSFWQWIQEPTPKDLGNALNVSMRLGQPREFRAVIQTATSERVAVQIQAHSFPRSIEKPVLRLEVLELEPGSTALRLKRSGPASR